MSKKNDTTTANLEGILATHGKQRSRWWVPVIVIALILGASGYYLARTTEGNGSGAIKYATQPSSVGNVTITVSATGNLEPTNEVEVGSEQSGIVKVVYVDYNDRVEVGQTLAELDTTRMDAEIQQAEASLASAKAQVLSAQATVREKTANMERLNNLRDLSESRAVSKLDLDTAQAELDRAIASQAQTEASVKQSEAILETSKTDLSKMTIVSPINGVVLSRSIDPGQTVAASFETPTLFVLAEDLSSMRLEVGVDEADISMVKDGQSATFTVDAFTSREFPATVRRVNYGSTNTDNVVTYTTVLDVDNEALELRPGMTATATITVKKLSDVLLVPNAALRFEPATTASSDEDSGESFLSKLLPGPPRQQSKNKDKAETGESKVWTLENGQLVPISIQTGLTDGLVTEVISGELVAGTELVAELETASK